MKTRTVMTLVVLILLICALFPIVALRRGSVTMPRCAEDVVLIGQGNFEDGVWDNYACGPALDNCGGE